MTASCTSASTTIPPLEDSTDSRSQTPIGQSEDAQFYRKIENRGGHGTLGFLICTEKFAETLEKERLHDRKNGLRVVPIDGEDLRRLVEATERGTVLRGFVERAVLT